MKPSPRLRPFPRRRRGAVLIVAMLLSAIIAISLSSYLRLANTTLATADRSFYSAASLNLAESGLERAMACFYEASNGTPAATAWNGWTLSGANATRTFSGFTPGPNATGTVRVYVQNYTMSGTPRVVVRATITPASGRAVEKWIELTLRPRSLFSLGLVARDTLTMNGAAAVDSWNSDPDGNPATAAIPYSVGVRRANGTVGCASAVNGALNIGNADVFGYVSTGGGTLSSGPGGVVSGSFTGSGIDASRVSTDFSANFPAVVTPTPSASNVITTGISSSITFPRAGDVAASDGKYYYVFGLGTNINLTGPRVVTIANHCIFILNNHQGVTALNTGGNGAIAVNAAASFVLYTNGNISAAGNGFMNSAGQAEKFLIYGTSTTSQSMSAVGNSGSGFAAYLPNGTVSLTGTSAVCGSIVAQSITVTGTADFHYDEALGSLSAGAGVAVQRWKELQSATERAAYSSQLNF